MSVLSFGSWVTFGPQLDRTKLAADCLGAAYDAGVNFFDNAEAYAGGRIGADHGRVHPSSWGGSATAYVVSTKVFWGTARGRPQHEATP